MLNNCDRFKKSTVNVDTELK